MTRFYERAYTLGLCHKCAAPTLHGVTDGLELPADPYALTGPGELAALISGRFTFTVHINAQKIRLYIRAAWDMAARSRPIVAQHRCGAPALDFDRDASRVFIDMLIPRQEPVTCPF